MIQSTERINIGKLHFFSSEKLFPCQQQHFLCELGTESDNNIHRDDLRLHHRRALGMAINNWNCVLACNMGSTRAHLPRILQIFPVDIFVSYELGCWKIVVSLSIHFPVISFFSNSSQQWRQDSADGQHENCDDSRPMRMNLTKSEKRKKKNSFQFVEVMEISENFHVCRPRFQERQ